MEREQGEKPTPLKSLKPWRLQKIAGETMLLLPGSSILSYLATKIILVIFGWNIELFDKWTLYSDE